MADHLWYPPIVTTRYSDLSMIVLALVIERITGCHLSTFVHREVFSRLGMESTAFRPIPGQHKHGSMLRPITGQHVSMREAGCMDPRVVPTEVDSLHRNKLLWGEVHDPTAWIMGSVAGHAGLFLTELPSSSCTSHPYLLTAHHPPIPLSLLPPPSPPVHDPTAWIMGGVAGHAGLFSTIVDVSKFACCMLAGGTDPTTGHQLVSSRTLRLFTTPPPPSDHNPRPFALGWDVAIRRGKDGYTSAGRFMGPRTFGHTGFTGTSLWIDPDRNTFVALLSNAVHPSVVHGQRMAQHGYKKRGEQQHVEEQGEEQEQEEKQEQAQHPPCRPSKAGGWEEHHPGEAGWQQSSCVPNGAVAARVGLEKQQQQQQQLGVAGGCAAGARSRPGYSRLATPATPIPSPPLLHSQQRDRGEGGGREGGLELQIPSPPLPHPQQGDGGERGGGRGGGGGGAVQEPLGRQQVPSPPLLHPQQGEVEEGGGGGGLVLQIPSPHLLHPQQGEVGEGAAVRGGRSRGAMARDDGAMARDGAGRWAGTGPGAGLGTGPGAGQVRGRALGRFGAGRWAGTGPGAGQVRGRVLGRYGAGRWAGTGPGAGQGRGRALGRYRAGRWAGTGPGAGQVRGRALGRYGAGRWAGTGPGAGQVRGRALGRYGAGRWAGTGPGAGQVRGRALGMYGAGRWAGTGTHAGQVRGRALGRYGAARWAGTGPGAGLGESEERVYLSGAALSGGGALSLDAAVVPPLKRITPPKGAAGSAGNSPPEGLLGDGRRGERGERRVEGGEEGRV
ncbi:unnamed protein product [Closterium sp. Naga37s-1]|nr:unnamed protein product [Closterium sp. Naga37s-1]